MPLNFQSLLGFFALPLLAWILSEDKKNIPWRTVSAAMALQMVLGVALLKIPGGENVFAGLDKLAQALEAATRAGTSFVFGYVGGGPAPFEMAKPQFGYVLAFRGLFLVLVVSALSSLLFYWKILPMVVRVLSRALQRLLGIGGAEGLSAACNVIMGMIEAPLFIRPYLSKLSRGELFCVMTCGMATIAGTVMVLYANFISKVIPNALGNILVASIISLPAAIAIARIMVPAPKDQLTDANQMVMPPVHSTMEAITNGALEGMKLLINIIAMLVVLVALVHLVNQMLGWIPDVSGAPLTLERMLGWFMAPVVWLIGIPWDQCVEAGSLMGIKTVLNEFLAYLAMAGMEPGTLSHRSMMIMTYAMCGFANLGSLGIMIGGLTFLAPDRAKEIARLGPKSIISGTLATLLTGAVVGVLY